MAPTARVTLPERFYPLRDADAVDRLLAEAEWCAIFKAGSGDRSVDAWVLVQKAFEARGDVAMGFLQLPQARAASDRVAERTGVAHKSPQIILIRHGEATGHLDERAIAPEPLSALMSEQLPSTPGAAIVNRDAVSLDAYRSLVEAFVDGRLPEERFQWAYLERLAREAAWRDDGTFALLDALFDNPDGRDLRPARVIAREFQAQLAGSAEPLGTRAERWLERVGRAAPPTD